MFARIFFCKIIFLLVISASAYAQQSKVSKSAILYKDPSVNSAQVVVLNSGKALNILERKGFWVRVDVSGQVGWLKLSDVELPNNPNKIDPLSTGRTSGGNIVNTAGARGLSPDELKNSKPNPVSVELAIQNSAKVTDSDVVRFMTEGGILQRTNLPEVQSAKLTTSGNSVDTKKSSVPKKSKIDNEEW